MILPAYLQTYLTKIGGVNLYGEPNFRIVWAGDRLKWNGSPKYRQAWRQERWIIEIYRPVGFYGDRAKWEQTHYTSAGLPIIHEAKGPFPTRGDYEWIDTVEEVDAQGNRNYMMPTEAYLDMIVHLHALVVGEPQTFTDDQIDAADAAKRESNYQYILERVKEKTDPKFRPAFAAISNTAAFVGKDVDSMAQSVEALA